jgi:hypothetical protein
MDVDPDILLLGLYYTRAISRSKDFVPTSARICLVARDSTREARDEWAKGTSMRTLRFVSLAVLIVIIPASSFAGVFISVNVAPPVLPV